MDSELFKEAKILYVEDDKNVREAIASILARRVKKLFLANNGFEGIETFKYKKDEINLIITDIEMPIMDGLEMIEKIKEIDKEVMVIIITAFDDEAHQSNLADEFVVKPIKKELLFEVIKNSIIKHKEIKA